MTEMSHSHSDVIFILVASEPGEKIEFSSLMYEIKVLPLNYPGFYFIYKLYKEKKKFNLI